MQISTPIPACGRLDHHHADLTLLSEFPLRLSSAGTNPLFSFLRVTELETPHSTTPPEDGGSSGFPMSLMDRTSSSHADIPPLFPVLGLDMRRDAQRLSLSPTSSTSAPPPPPPPLPLSPLPLPLPLPASEEVSPEEETTVTDLTEGGWWGGSEPLSPADLPPEGTGRGEGALPPSGVGGSAPTGICGIPPRRPAPPLPPPPLRPSSVEEDESLATMGSSSLPGLDGAGAVPPTATASSATTPPPSRISRCRRHNSIPPLRQSPPGPSSSHSRQGLVIVPWQRTHFAKAVTVTIAEVALGHGDPALLAVSELDPGVATPGVRAYELLAVVHVLGYDEVGSLRHTQQISFFVFVRNG